LSLLEEQINQKLALKQSQSSKEGLSILPPIEKTLDDLTAVKQF